MNGGEGGIRTLEGLLIPTPLAGVRLRPLGHLSQRLRDKDIAARYSKETTRMRERGRAEPFRAGRGSLRDGTLPQQPKSVPYPGRVCRLLGDELSRETDPV